MTYTFDEAIEKVEQLANFEVGKTTGNIRRDFKLELGDVRDILAELREEYAPTIEMTKEQHDYIFPLIKEGKELGATFTEFWEVYKFIGASKNIDQTFVNQEQAMQVWLHPETIYVVDK